MTDTDKLIAEPHWEYQPGDIDAAVERLRATLDQGEYCLCTSPGGSAFDELRVVLIALDETRRALSVAQDALRPESDISRRLPKENDVLIRRERTMSAHDHREYVEGCYRCDISRDEFNTGCTEECDDDCRADHRGER